MSGKDVTTELSVGIGDPLAGKIRDSILGVEKLRSENRRLTDEIKDLEVTTLQLESEIQSLKLTLEQDGGSVSESLRYCRFRSASACALSLRSTR
jgi:hypothetical protein